MQTIENFPRKSFFSRLPNRLYWTSFLVALATLSLLIRYHISELNNKVQRSGLSNEATIASRNVLVDHIDIETGIRGYLVSNDRIYLQPYYEGRGRMVVDMAALGVAVERYYAELRSFTELKSDSNSFLTELAEKVVLLDAGKYDQAKDRFIKFPTKPTMDKIRSHLISIQSREDQRQHEETFALERSIATLITMINAFAFVAILLSIAMAFGLIKTPGDHVDQDRI